MLKIRETFSHLLLLFTRECVPKRGKHNILGQTQSFYRIDCDLSIEQLFIHSLFFLWSFADPRQWSEEHVLCWLKWAIKEFSLEGFNFGPFDSLKGREMVALGRDGFLAIAPPFTGDILWEHLEILQKGKWRKRETGLSCF